MTRRSDRSELKSGSIIAALALVLALLGGCSAVRFAYNQAPDVAYWWLDAYVDFTDAQTPRARDAITQWFGWHRRTQLPDYAALLARAQTEVLVDQSSEQACTWFNTLRGRARTAADQALPFAASLAVALSPAQIKHIERRYDKNNREFRDEYLQDSPQDRLKASVKRTVDRAEMLYGRLDDAQVRRLTPLVADSPFDPALWFAERQRRQQDLLQLLRRLTAEQARPDTTEAALRAYVQRIESSPNETYRRYMQRLEPYNCGVAAALHNITTPAQRQAAAAKLKGWESDLRSLSGMAVEQ